VKPRDGCLEPDHKRAPISKNKSHDCIPCSMYPRMFECLKERNDDIQSRKAVQSTESEKVCKIKEFCLPHEAGETELKRSHSNRRQMKPAGPLFGVFSNLRLRLFLPPSYRPPSNHLYREHREHRERSLNPT
jgi:hypothetical protein